MGTSLASSGKPGKATRESSRQVCGGRMLEKAKQAEFQQVIKDEKAGRTIL
jgi:hypothetical protein